MQVFSKEEKRAGIFIFAAVSDSHYGLSICGYAQYLQNRMANQRVFTDYMRRVRAFLAKGSLLSAFLR